MTKLKLNAAKNKDAATMPDNNIFDLDRLIKISQQTKKLEKEMRK